MDELLKITSEQQMIEVKATPDQLVELFLVNMVRNNIDMVCEINKRIELPMDAMLQHAQTQQMVWFAYWTAGRRGLAFTKTQITRAFDWHVATGHYVSAMMLSQQANLDHLADNAMMSFTLCQEEKVRPSTDWIRIMLLPFAFGAPTARMLYTAAKYINPIAVSICAFLFDTNTISYQCGLNDDITAIILLERYVKIDWMQVLVGAASRNHTSLMYICRTKVPNMTGVVAFVQYKRTTGDMNAAVNLLKLWGLF